MRVLLDTNLLVRAAITPQGPAREILRILGANVEHVLVVSPYLLREVNDLLRRERIRAHWPLTDDAVNSYCQHLANAGEQVFPQPQPLVIRDPKDQAIIETAIAGSADVICTFDAHFYTRPVLEFCATHGIKVMNDVDILHLLRRQC